MCMHTSGISVNTDDRSKFCMQIHHDWTIISYNKSPRGLAAHLSIAINASDAISPLTPKFILYSPAIESVQED